MKLWKFAIRLNDGRVVSAHDHSTEWAVGKTNTVQFQDQECVNLNGCRSISAARGYVQGNVLMLVEATGRSHHRRGSDKWGHESQTCLKMWDVRDFVKASAPAWAEYDKVCAPAWAEYVKVCASAWAEYKKVCAPALAEYDKALRRLLCTKEREI